MKKIITIIGAGLGLGLSIGKRFGKEDFKVIFVARNEEKLTTMVNELDSIGMESEYYVTDIRNLDQLEYTMKAILEKYGKIDVVEYSPYAGPQTFRNVLTMSTDDITNEYEAQILPLVKVMEYVVPSMIEHKSGAILINTGASALFAIPSLGNTGIICSGLRNYAQNLHNVLKEEGIYVGLQAVATFISKGTEGDPDLIADSWYDMYMKQERFEKLFPEINM